MSLIPSTFLNLWNIKAHVILITVGSYITQIRHVLDFPINIHVFVCLFV